MILALTACGGGSVAGRWFEGSRVQTCASGRAIEFASDGQVKERGRTVGAWRQSGANVIVNGEGREITLTLDGDTLTMVSGGGARAGDMLRRCPN